MQKDFFNFTSKRKFQFGILFFLIDNNDYNTLLSLKQLYYMNGDYKKSDEMKKALEAIKK